MIYNDLINREKTFDYLMMKYGHYENKRVSRDEVMNILRDYYYLVNTGMRFDEWVLDQD